MVDRKKGSGKSSNALAGRRLKELAAEATKHLDEVLSESGASEAPGRPRASEGGARGRTATRGRARERSRGMRVVEGAESRPGAASAPSAAKGAKSRTAARALVAHVSPGAARLLANLLNHKGLEAQVADGACDIESVLASQEWDVVFAQGSPMPYPGRRISLAALSHCAGRGTPVVLLSRRGDSLIPEAAEGTAVGLLEWPFSAEKVIRVLSEVIPDYRSS